MTLAKISFQCILKPSQKIAHFQDFEYGSSIFASFAFWKFTFMRRVGFEWEEMDRQTKQTFPSFRVYGYLIR